MNPLPDRIGPYKINRPVGQGGFGEVFEAVEEHTRQRVAVKVLLPEKAGDRETVARFIQEAGALETLKDHPDVVRVLRSGETDDGRPYFAMEFLEGLTGLAQKMVQDARGNDYRLALLGHTLRSLWFLRARREITHEQ